MQATAVGDTLTITLQFSNWQNTHIQGIAVCTPMSVPILYMVSMANPWKHLFFLPFFKTYHSYICSFTLETLHMFFLHQIYWSTRCVWEKNKNHRTPLRPKNAAGFQCGGILGPTCTRIRAWGSKVLWFFGQKKNGQKQIKEESQFSYAMYIFLRQLCWPSCFFQSFKFKLMKMSDACSKRQNGKTGKVCRWPISRHPRDTKYRNSPAQHYEFCWPCDTSSTCKLLKYEMISYITIIWAAGCCNNTFFVGEKQKFPRFLQLVRIFPNLSISSTSRAVSACALIHGSSTAHHSIEVRS